MQNTRRHAHAAINVKCCESSSALEDLLERREMIFKYKSYETTCKYKLEKKKKLWLALEILGLRWLNQCTVLIIS